MAKKLFNNLVTKMFGGNKDRLRRDLQAYAQAEYGSNWKYVYRQLINRKEIL